MLRRGINRLFVLLCARRKCVVNSRWERTVVPYINSARLAESVLYGNSVPLRGLDTVREVWWLPGSLHVVILSCYHSVASNLKEFLLCPPLFFFLFSLALLMLLDSFYHRASLIFLSVIITAVVIVVHSSNSSTLYAVRRTKYQPLLCDFSTDSFFYIFSST